MSESVRLAKRVSDLMACSRRDAETYIAGGFVLVDGRVIEQPNFMVSDHKVELDAKATLKPLPPITILLHKPAGYDFGLTYDLLQKAKHRPKKTGEKPAMEDDSDEALDVQALNPEVESTPDPELDGIDPEIKADLIKYDALQFLTLETQEKGDRTGIRPLHSHFNKLTPTIRLESAASGLVIYTQDRAIARKLIDDASRVEQEYIVQVEGELTEENLKRLNTGFYHKGVLMPAAKVSWQNEHNLRFAIKNVQLDQIEQMCQGVGLTVTGMKRIRIGRISMSKLAVGEWRYLLGYERF
jgi:23S rRNA pseudouridine2604 synthase